ncbi:MAG: ABC transporter permease [Alphaproteobacteria bacterium]|nr:ABC transporter permease [Alphaproteobacteria bacterium]
MALGLFNVGTGPGARGVGGKLAWRLVRAAAVSFWVMVIAFGLMRLAPGDPVIARLGAEAEPAAIDRLRRELRLDVDPVTQFVEYFLALVRGDLGRSIENGRLVTDIVLSSVPVTLWIIVVTILFSVVLAVPLALAVATARHPSVPYAFRATTAAFLAVPAFFTALIGLIVLGVQFRIAPVIGYEPSFPRNLAYVWLPALVICTHLVPILSRVLYASLKETMSEEFVETGVVRGVSRSRFAWSYLLRPSLAPSVVLLSYMVGVMIGSTVIIETIFSLPGIGRALVGAVINRDYPVVQGCVLLFGLFVVAINLVGDIFANWLDPRVGLS